eukprot:scaffold211486_cov30-Tisochrysis_lutea.AAC.1
MSRALLAVYGMPRPAGRASVDGAHADDPVSRLPPESYDALFLSSAGGSLSHEAALAKAVKLLSPGGALELGEVVWLWPNGGVPPAEVAPALACLTSSRLAALRTADALRRALVLSGLTPVGGVTLEPLTAEQLRAAAAAMYPQLAEAAQRTPTAGEASDALHAIGELLRPHVALGKIIAKKPSYTQGVSFSLRSRAPVAPPASSAPSPASDVLDAWAAAARGTSEVAADMLVDEDDLLDEEDREAKIIVRPDCDPDAAVKRRACKNCSCGLREELEAADGVAKTAPKSACGNCGKGDAFRCATCPHRGKPAFEEGETVMLDSSNFMPVDAGGGPAQKVDSNGAPGGLVKLGADDLVDDF